MQPGDKTAFGIGGLGLGSAAIGMTVEHVYPHAVPWVWQTLFWGGVVFFAVSALYLLHLHFPRNHVIFAVNGPALGRAKLITLGMIMSFSGAILAMLGLALVTIGNMQSTKGNCSP